MQNQTQEVRIFFNKNNEAPQSNTRDYVTISSLKDFERNVALAECIANNKNVSSEVLALGPQSVKMTEKETPSGELYMSIEGDPDKVEKILSVLRAYGGIEEATPPPPRPSGP